MKALVDSVALLCEHTAKLESSLNTHVSPAQSHAPQELEDARALYRTPTNREEWKLLDKSPVYNGTGNIKGFFSFFDRWCASGNLSDDDSLTALCSAIRGEAWDHLSNS